MRATEILREEHLVIQQVLNCLEEMSDRACINGELDGSAARDMVDFFRHFADGCHHSKEEACLFPLMEARGFDRDRGPTGVMLAEHEQGRACLKAMEADIDAAAAGDRNAVARFADAAAAYTQLLHEHIFKENQRLFPMADQVFSEADQRMLLDRFVHVERHDMGQGTHERYLKLADNLAERFNVKRETSDDVQPHTCCGHVHA
ncbi:MAG TPA: hemerythrin domain-containing protein [Gemmataceae bacterium]|nr:hemerythrin domain-containing protein [Gemmataceae bacterium]